MPSLPHSFYNRPVLTVAEELIGCYLVKKNGTKTERYMITETEAYDGAEDLANHASKGKTRRTEIMFGLGGYFYIYLIYGMYEMLNIVTGAQDYPAAVLIRGIEGTSGPGRLTKKLKIARNLNGKKVGKESGLWVESRKAGEKFNIKKTARIGVNYAGPIWSKKEYRFVLETT